MGHRRCRTVSYLRRCCYWKRYCSLQICFSPPARWGSLDFNTAPHHTELPASSAWSYYLSIFVFTQLWTKNAGCLANRRGTLRLVNIEKADQEKHPQWLDTPTLVTTCHHKSPRIPKVGKRMAAATLRHSHECCHFTQLPKKPWRVSAPSQWLRVGT